MSGKAKGPATPEEEREQLRQLTREAHEAAKDARAALRELRAEREQLLADMVAAAAAYGSAVMSELGEQFQSSRETLVQFKQVVADKTAEAVKAIEYNHAVLAGFKTSEEMQDWLIETLGINLIEGLSINPAFVREVAEHVIAAAEGRRPRGPAGRPEILVATPEALRDYRAAGGDPGIVIDMTAGKGPR